MTQVSTANTARTKKGRAASRSTGESKVVTRGCAPVALRPGLVVGWGESGVCWRGSRLSQASFLGPRGVSSFEG